MFDYVRDPKEIYRRSFATARRECDLSALPDDLGGIALRLVHACGMPDIVAELAWDGAVASAGRAALAAGAPVIADCRMTADGVIRARLPADNQVLCPLADESVPGLAHAGGTTRSAAAVELWRPHLAGAVVAIGNAPTALFHLLNMLEDSACPRPAGIIGCPVGFEGAAESKQPRWASAAAPCVIVEGRLGGSAVTVAALNAMADRSE